MALFIQQTSLSLFGSFFSSTGSKRGLAPALFSLRMITRFVRNKTLSGFRLKDHLLLSYHDLDHVRRCDYEVDGNKLYS